ncbi:MAG: FtsW/RodA/SpoVE family cell cycle protein, partial [Planctomycetaceae bacterium]|nr:FtsW/RodA/SpoVE family cell cycle protein [Planctomycetaceae bacterium]
MLELLKRIHWSIPVLSLAIYAFGLAGLQRADELYGASRLFERQLIWAAIAIPVMMATVAVPYRSLRSFSTPAYLLCVVLLVVVLFMPAINGSRRWIPLGFLDFQPSEVTRLTFILALAAHLMHQDRHRNLTGLTIPFLMTFVPLLLVLKEPDLGTAMLFLPVLFAVLFAAGARTKHLTMAAITGLLLMPVLWTQMNAEQRSRVVSVFRQQDGGNAPAGDGFHLHQSKQILSLGGIRGLTMEDAESLEDPATLQLPAARTDFIFVMIGERFGLLGCSVLLLLYAV